MVRSLTAALLASAALLGASIAGAQMTVQPVSVQLQPGQQAAALTITNDGAEDMAFQVRPFAWSHAGGEDRLDPTNELVLSPPLGTIRAGGMQVIRVVLRDAPQGKEEAYRILLDQIPPPGAPGAVRIAFRLSMPVFAEPASRINPNLDWRVEQRGGAMVLAATNSGTRHEKVNELTVAGPGGVVLTPAGNALPYVLAGETRHWPLTGGPVVAGGDLRVSALGATGPISQSVRISTGQ